uniref:Uncharacterized protein n=1 Tax=Astyanax mexicanus TaxID=7994 RepID=A0A8B9JK26_ASTMX
CLIMTMPCLMVGVVGNEGTDWTGKLLVVPMDGSHWTGLKAVAEELGRRGHKVVVVIPEVSMRLGAGKHYVTKTFPVPYGQDLIDQMTAQTSQHITGFMSLLEQVSELRNQMYFVTYLMISTSESLFFNQELMGFLMEQKFDAVLTDPAMPAGAILAYNLSLPAVYMLRGMPCGLDSKATRVLNVLVSILESSVCKVLYGSFEDLASRVMNRPVSMVEILSSGAVWLLRYDFTAEFPKPLMPNMVLIGGLNCAITSPLKPVSTTDKGCVLQSK